MTTQAPRARTSLARATTWLAAGRGIVAVFSLALPIILARKLSQTDYGLFKQVDLVGTLLLPFLLVGFDKSITFFVPRKERTAEEEISSPVVSLLGIALAVLCFALISPDAFGRLLGTASIPLLTATAATYAAASAVQMVAARALVAVDRAKVAGVLPVVVGVPRTAALVAAVLVDPRLDLLLRVILVFAVLSVVVWLGTLVAAGCLRAALRPSVLKRHLGYGGTLAVGSMIQAWGVQLDNYLVASTLPPATFAIYRVGRLRVPFLPIFSRSLIDATAPRYSSLESERRYPQMAALWKLSSEILMPIGLLLSVFLASTAHWTIPLAYPGYEESIAIFRVYAFAILLESLVGIEQLLRALSALRFLFVSTVVGLLLRIAVGLSVIEQGSLWLLTIGQLGVSVALFVARLVYVRGRLGVSLPALVPFRAITDVLPLVAVGLVITWAVDRFVVAPGWIRFLGVCPWWGFFLVVLIWRQGLLHRILPPRLRDRLGPLLTPPRDMD